MITQEEENTQKGVREKILLGSYRLLRAVAIRVLPKTLNPRMFSNALLRSYGRYFSGDIINVSGWDDRDSEGGYYQDYFPKKSSYVVSNFAISDKGFGSLQGKDTEEISLDLEAPLPPALAQKFTAVFNHTTLEHIFAFETAFANICAMSSDAVILVVPLLQQIHIAESFGDYWRPTTLTLMKLFTQQGFTPLVIATNDQPFFPVYCFAIAVRDPKKYEGIIIPSFNFQSGGALFGSSLKPAALKKLLENI